MYNHMPNLKYCFGKCADIQSPRKATCTTVPSISSVSAFWGLSESLNEKNHAGEVPLFCGSKFLECIQTYLTL